MPETTKSKCVSCGVEFDQVPMTVLSDYTRNGVRIKREGRRIYVKSTCSNKCKKAHALALRRIYNRGLTAKGLCQTCKAPSGKFVECEKHRRLKTINKHRKGIHKTYYLGSKLSPERAAFIMLIAKESNPLLKANWNEVSPWIEKHYELWRENQDSVINSAVHVPAWDVYWIADKLADAWLERNNGLSLEDFVIQKVDREREGLKMEQLIRASVI